MHHESPTFIDVVCEYVGFGAAEAESLRLFHRHAEPHFEAIASHFYESIDADPAARAVMVGQAQIDRLKRSLVAWLSSGLTGPHDENFYQRRTRIGRKHVQIDLPQRYMLTAMNGVRRDLQDLVESTFEDLPEARRHTAKAVDMWLDIELAIMLETYKEDSEEQLRRNERLASMGQLAGTIGHELRNPLSVIESSLFLLRSSVDETPRTLRHLDRIEAQVHLAGETITDLLEMTRGRPAQRKRILVADLVERALSSIAWPAAIELRVDIQADLEVSGESALLTRALRNLLENAIAALEEREDGRVWVSAFADEGRVVIEVADDGPGFDEEILARAFEPLVTGRARGVGLGLALVRNICERHNGIVFADSRLDGGAVVRIQI